MGRLARRAMGLVLAALMVLAVLPRASFAVPSVSSFWYGPASGVEPETAMAIQLTDGRLYLYQQDGMTKALVDNTLYKGADDWESHDEDNPYFVEQVVCEGDVVFEDVSGLFKDCEHLWRADFSCVDNTGSNCAGLFDGCTALRSITVGKSYDTSIVGAFPENPLGGDSWWSVSKGQWVKTSEIRGTYTKVADSYLTKRPEWTRLSGMTALDTAVAVTNADGVFPDGYGDTVFLATSDGYWDALAATGLAGMYGAPVLITPGDHLATQTKGELLRLKPSKVMVMGGKAAISSDVEDQMREVLPGVEIVRMAGSNAPGTAVEIYKDGADGHDWGNGEPGPSTVIIATSNGYWDALSIAPYAYWSWSPILLTNYSDDASGRILGDPALAAIKEYWFERAVIVGGGAAVSTDVEQQLQEAGISASGILRLSGKTALETSASIAKWELEQGMTLSHLAVATNNGYWDALTGAALCAQENSVLVLASPTDGYTAFDAVYDPAQVLEGHVFGGRGAVSDESLEYFKAK